MFLIAGNLNSYKRPLVGRTSVRNHRIVYNLRTWPCIFIMTTVLVRLQTTMLSGFFGKRWTLLTLTLPPAADPPKDLKVFWHSVVFVFHIFTVPSEDALKSWRQILVLLESFCRYLHKVVVNVGNIFIEYTLWYYGHLH